MRAADFHEKIMLPAMAWAHTVAGIEFEPQAMRLMLAIAGQESGWKYRAQVVTSGEPPAKSFWQMERMGGVNGTLLHMKSRPGVLALCEAASVDPSPTSIWRAIEGHDGLAAGFARLLLLTDPKALPTTEQDGWDCYARNWRPGKPKRDTWASRWAEATTTLKGA